MGKSSTLFNLIIVMFFLFLIPMAAKGFLYILKIDISFVEAFIAFVLCTIVVKWFAMLIKNS